MYFLDKTVLNQVAGGMATYSNGVFTVTGSSTFTLNTLKLSANQAVNTATGTVLYSGSGSESTFCHLGTFFMVVPVTDGHSYVPWDDC